MVAEYLTGAWASHRNVAQNRIRANLFMRQPLSGSVRESSSVSTPSINNDQIGWRCCSSRFPMVAWYASVRRALRVKVSDGEDVYKRQEFIGSCSKILGRAGVNQYDMGSRVGKALRFLNEILNLTVAEGALVAWVTSKHDQYHGCLLYTSRCV